MSDPHVSQYAPHGICPTHGRVSGPVQTVPKGYMTSIRVGRITAQCPIPGCEHRSNLQDLTYNPWSGFASNPEMPPVPNPAQGNMNATTKEGSITGRAHDSIIERVLDRVQKLPANAVTIGSAAVTTVATLAAQIYWPNAAAYQQQHDDPQHHNHHRSNGRHDARRIAVGSRSAR